MPTCKAHVKRVYGMVLPGSTVSFLMVENMPLILNHSLAVSSLCIFSFFLPEALQELLL